MRSLVPGDPCPQRKGCCCSVLVPWTATMAWLSSLSPKFLLPLRSLSVIDFAPSSPCFSSDGFTCSQCLLHSPSMRRQSLILSNSTECEVSPTAASGPVLSTFPHSGWDRRFLFILLRVLDLLASSRTMTTTLTLAHLDLGSQDTTAVSQLLQVLSAHRPPRQEAVQNPVHSRRSCPGDASLLPSDPWVPFLMRKINRELTQRHTKMENPRVGQAVESVKTN